MILSLLIVLALAYLAWTISCLEKNVRTARDLKIPFVRIPIDVNNNIWVIFQPWLWKLLAHLPISWSSYPDFVRFSHRNWHFLEKSSPSAQLGQIWALVSPGGVHLHVSNPDAIEEIFTRWRDFIRPVWKYQMLAIYGPSVFTVELDRWPRHRKVVAAPFNESIMKFVWDESLRQSQAMLSYWTAQENNAIPDLHEDFRTLSLNVLAATAFRESYDFIGSANLRHKRRSTDNYRDALHIVQKNLLVLMLVPYHFLALPMMPRIFSNIGHAAISLGNIMISGIMAEREALNQGMQGSGGLITSLVRVLDLEATQATEASDSRDETKKLGSLSNREVLGNVFVMNIAGHDTTANTLGFAMMLLAANPEVQEWLHEEVITVITSEDIQDWDYDSFPKLNRCQAVILETLRLYAPITGLPKVTHKKMQTIRVGDKKLTIPSGTETFPMLLGVQTDPKYWIDPYTWKPSRWILRSEASAGVTEENVFVPRKGTFFPWAEGPQGCPGKKFSLVEAVAVLAGIFRSHRMRVKREAGETTDHARSRAQACVDDVNYQFLLKMNHTDRAKLECVRIDTK